MGVAIAHIHVVLDRAHRDRAGRAWRLTVVEAAKNGGCPIVNILYCWTGLEVFASFEGVCRAFEQPGLTVERFFGPLVSRVD